LYKFTDSIIECIIYHNKYIIHPIYIGVDMKRYIILKFISIFILLTTIIAIIFASMINVIAQIYYDYDKDVAGVQRYGYAEKS